MAIWRPEDTCGPVNFSTRMSDRFQDVQLESRVMDTGTKMDSKYWKADDMSTGFPKPVRARQSPKQFMDDYMERKESSAIVSHLTPRSPESDYHSLMADRMAVQNGENNLFTGYHRAMSRGLMNWKRDSIIKGASSLLGVDTVKLNRALDQSRAEMGGSMQVADILGVDAPTLKSAFNLAKAQEDWRDSSRYTNDREMEREETSTFTTKNAFGAIDINVIFIRDWLEQKGQSIFGNKFAFFFIILTTAVVGGLVVLMLSGAMSDIITTFKWDMNE